MTIDPEIVDALRPFLFPSRGISVIISAFEHRISVYIATNLSFMTFRFLLFFSLISLFIASGCSSSGSSSSANSLNEQSEGDSVSQASDASRRMRSRGLNDHSDQPGFSFEREFPALTQALSHQPELLQTLSGYAQTVVNPDAIRSEEILINILEQRDSVMIPRVEAALMTADANQDLYTVYDQLQNELQRIGMQMTFAEGTFTSIGPSSFLQEQMEQYASKAFQFYLNFSEARTESFNGEYPFLNMKPYQDMIEIGMELSALNENTYFPKIKDHYQQALIYFSDIHRVQDPTARNASLFVQGVETDMYPYMTEADTRVAYINQPGSSNFRKAMERILANPSTMSIKPDHLYLVVVEWADNEEMARSRVTDHLTSGEDIPHHLQINLPDGTSRYAIVYRFFEDESNAEQAFETAQTSFPSVELMMVSVKGNELYQIGA